MSSNPVEEKWPAGVVEVSEARDWIASVLPGHPLVLAPTEVYAAKANFGVTARFAVSGGEDVVFKANVYEGFDGAPFAFDLLSRHCAGQVPEVIAWQEDQGRSWILMRPFEGAVLSSLRSTGVLKEMGRALARIQTQVAALPPFEMSRLPRVDMGSIIDLFDALVGNIETHTATVWESQVKLSEILGFPGGELAARLQGLRPQVVSWIEELDGQKWPDTICHGDLHAENAVLQADGRVLIYDWEDAFIGCPFLALERLLVQAWNWDAGSESVGPWGYAEGTPGQEQVREAYLETLPFGEEQSRRRACDLAMGLAVIREAYAEWRWALSVEWPDGNPEWTAQLMNRLFQHRDRIEEQV